MRIIKFENEHRKNHYDFFSKMELPHFNITAPVPIDPLLDFIEKENISLTHAIVYVLSRAAQEIAPFRWRIRGNQVVEHDVLKTSFTVSTKASDVFSFCTVAFDKEAQSFFEAIEAVKAKMNESPSIKDEEGADDYLFFSSFPWVSFTGFQHAMPLKAGDSVPRVAWGKIFKDNGLRKMPLSVQVHHALVDGKQVGEYFQLVESMFADCKLYF